MIGVLAATAFAPVAIATVATILGMLVARHPDWAAIAIVVLPVVVLVGGVLVTVLVGLGVGPMQDAGLDRVVAAGPVEVPVVRRVVGLVTATGFLVLAGWLVRTGHWSRVDEEDWPE